MENGHEGDLQYIQLHGGRGRRRDQVDQEVNNKGGRGTSSPQYEGEETRSGGMSV